MKVERVEGKNIAELKKEKLAKRDEKKVSDTKLKKHKSEDGTKKEKKEKKPIDEEKARHREEKKKQYEEEQKRKQQEKAEKEKASKSEDDLLQEARIDANSILRMQSIRRASLQLATQLHDASSPKNSPTRTTPPKNSPSKSSRPTSYAESSRSSLSPTSPKSKSTTTPNYLQNGSTGVNALNALHKGSNSAVNNNSTTSNVSGQGASTSKAASNDTTSSNGYGEANAHNFDYYTHKVAVQRDENTAGWEEYIKNIIEPGSVADAAIIGEHNTLWAISKNLHMTYEEIINLRKGFEKNGSFFSTGISIGGVKYMALRSDERSAYGKKGSMGCVCVKTKRTILVGIYTHTTHSTDATALIEKVADGLIANNF